jgi:hypothetical protein
MLPLLRAVSLGSDTEHCGQGFVVVDRGCGHGAITQSHLGL